MDKVYGFIVEGVEKATPFVKEQWRVVVVSVVGVAAAILIRNYLNRRRQDKFRELYKYKEDVIFKIKPKCIEITSGYNPLKKFVENQESLEDFFGTKIHTIEKEKRKFKCDLVKLYTEPFKLYRVSRFTVLNYKKVYGAVSYSGQHIFLDQQDFCSCLYVGMPGSGKTAAALASMEYSVQSNRKAGRKIKRIIITPKKSDFKSYIQKGDELFSVETIEDYRKLAELFREATDHTLEAVNNNKLSKIFYVFFLDEILTYLSSGKEITKELGQAKVELAGVVENFARLTARAGRQLLLAGTQDPSVGSCLVKSKFFTLKFIGRLETVSQAQVFNFGAELLDSGLKKGVFYNSVTREKVRFPLMTTFKEIE